MLPVVEKGTGGGHKGAAGGAEGGLGGLNILAISGALSALIGDHPPQPQRGLEGKGRLLLHPGKRRIHLALNLIGRLKRTDDGAEGVHGGDGAAQRNLVDLFPSPLGAKLTLLHGRHSLCSYSRKRGGKDADRQKKLRETGSR